MINIKTKSIISAKGKAPKNTSLREISGSFSVALMTKQEIPNGGVRRPISAPITVTIPNRPDPVTYPN